MSLEAPFLVAKGSKYLLVSHVLSLTNKHLLKRNISAPLIIDKGGVNISIFQNQEGILYEVAN